MEAVSDRFLILINKNLSSRTSRFWKDNERLIRSEFSDADLYFLDSDQPQTPIEIVGHDLVILIGDDSFFNRIINCFHVELAGIQIAFFPDNGKSALTSGLRYPKKSIEIIDLIKSRQTIPLDLIRCHYIDIQGLPANCLVLNDIVIGSFPRPVPLLLRTFFQWCHDSSLIPIKKKENKITLLQHRKEICREKYIILLILLGNTVTHGPRILDKNRINLKKFELFQLNSQSAIKIISPLAGLFFKKPSLENRNLLHKQLSEVEVHGLGKENILIVDGIHLGRLPASFTLLPKTFNVISPLNVVALKKQWERKVPISHEITTPIGSREVLRKKE